VTGVKSPVVPATGRSERVDCDAAATLGALRGRAEHPRRIATPYSGAGVLVDMFTGIVEGTGEVVGVDAAEDGRRLRIRHGFDAVEHGQSISVSGVCLTVERFEDDWFEVFLASETVAKTYLGTVGVGDAVNLERAMPADGRFDGHIVQGHVDGVATVEAVERVGDDWEFTFALPPNLGRYVVAKGSIALDGISLTVADRGEESITVAIIPTTYDLTTLSAKEPGDPVHVEVDVVAKYVERLVD
jgi:riboflavin synthase